MKENIERPKISMMGDGNIHYLTQIINEYSKYSDELEQEICSLCASEGMNPSPDLMHLFKKWKYE